MRRKYGDCQRDDGNCTICSLSSRGLDCHGKNIEKIAWLRMSRELTQPELAEMSGVSLRKIQYLESGEISAGNLTLRTAIALADALGVDVRELL